MNDTENEFLQLETKVVQVLKNIYDPEMPVNIYDLGLIYEIDADEDNNVRILMTLTAPNCPMVKELLDEIRQKINAIEDVQSLDLKLTFDPPWDKSMLSDEAKLELGFM
jgi:FeS assembly SUF system protein